MARERWEEKAYFKVDPNRQRPPEKHSCVERKLLDGAKLPLRKMKSASQQVGAAPAKPLTAAAQQLFMGAGRRAKGQLPPQGPASHRQGVSSMCYFEQQVPCQALLGGVAGKGRGAAHGLGVPPRG